MDDGAATRGYGQVALHGLAHALVDASCAALLFSAAASGRLPVELALAAAVAYDLLAFALQPVLGYFVNESAAAGRWARVGALMTASAFLLAQVPGGLWPAIALTGVGNAVFHLGGGVGSLLLEPGRSAAPGLFVAPGAAGLAAGIWMGSAGWLPWLPAVLLVAVVPLLRPIPSGALSPGPVGASGAPFPWAALAVLFGVIALRAVVGSGVPLPWRSEPALLATLTGAVVVGKALGGILADRYGRSLVAVGALCLSAPLLVLAPASAPAGVAGMLLFNMTMPVTLAATYGLMPERPGLGFGLTCLALEAGTLPFTLRLAGPLPAAAVVGLVLVSAALLWFALHPKAPEGLLAAPAPRPEEA